MISNMFPNMSYCHSVFITYHNKSKINSILMVFSVSLSIINIF